MPLLITSAGKAVISRFGALVNAAASFCCCKMGVPLHRCSSDANCQQWCNDGYADISQGENCRCPCPGRRGYPPGYDWTWDGITVNTTDKFYDFGPIEQPLPRAYRKYTTPGPFSLNKCMTEAERPLITYQLYDSDDTPHGDPQSDRLWFAAGVPSDPIGSPGACGNASTPDPTLNYPAAGIAAGFDYGLCAVGVVDGGYSGGFGFYPVTDYHNHYSRCGSVLSIPAISIPRYYGDGTISPVKYLNPGTVTITPTCRDCAGADLQTRGDLVSVCAYEYTFTVVLPDGPGHTDQLHVFQLFGGPFLWSGDDGMGNRATLQSATFKPDDPDYKCCNSPGCKCADGSSFDDFPGCPACWKLEITYSPVGGETPDEPGDLIYFGTGSCPPGSWSLLSGGVISFGSSDFIIESGGFVDGCRP